MSRAFHGSFTTARTHAADMAAMQRLVEDEPEPECSACFGEGGFTVYPSEHSHRTIWEECRECEGHGSIVYTGRA